VADICRRAGISQVTYFNRKTKYDGVLPPDMRRLKQFEDETAKLRKLGANLFSTRRRCRMSSVETCKICS
jgi:putative transposase